MTLRRLLSIIVAISFLLTSLGPLPQARADEPLSLPVPGTMVNLTPAFEPALIKGLTVDKDDPFRFNFIMDAGKSGLTGDALKKEGDRLVKYFFACLTIPEKDLWVNLSPYEKDRIIPQALGDTPLGRDLLAQDYILKQLTASLIYPEKNLGREFWNRVYTKARELYGTAQVPVNTFNKVWILADKATVYEHGQTAVVLDGYLKVMLEEDYLALQKHSVALPSASRNDTHSIGANIVRQIILPEIEKEVNTGKNFAPLRQIFNSLILASWYKKNLKEALLNQVYADKSTVKGVNLSDPSVKERIYQQYLQAYKKGVFNFIKEEIDPNTQETLPRKYFSGGFEVSPAMLTVEKDDTPGIMQRVVSKFSRSVALFSLAVSLSLHPALAAPPAVIVPHAVVAAQTISSSIREIQKANKAMLSKVIESWSKYDGLADLLTNVLTSLDGMGQPYGLATKHTQGIIKLDPESDPRSMLRQQIAGLLENNEKIRDLIIDGRRQGGNLGGSYVINAVSLDNIENLNIGKATGTSIEVYQEDGNGNLVIVSTINIQWGPDTRILISTDEGDFDYILQENGEFKTLSSEGITMKHNGSFISLGGETDTWPPAMKSFELERLSSISTKERHADSGVVDIYHMMSKAGLMTGWVSKSRAYAIAHLMRHVHLEGRPEREGGLAKIQAKNGLIEVNDMPITIKDLENNEQVYIYAGVHNLVEEVEGFINARSAESYKNDGNVRGLAIAQIKAEEKFRIDKIKIRETLEEYIRKQLKISPTLPGVDAKDRERFQERIETLITRIVGILFNDIPLDQVNQPGQNDIIMALKTELKKGKPGELEAVFGENEQYIHSLDWIIEHLPNTARPVGGKNASGDQQKLLDFVFSKIFTYLMRSEVHAIIDEESKDIAFGIGEGPDSTDTTRIVCFLDPVDGSSQLPDGGSFSSIFTFGYLMKGQRIDKTFKPRTQLLPSFDISFGPRTFLTLVNPSNQQRKPEVVRFRLTDIDGQIEFRRDLDYGNMLDNEIKNLKWQGLLPDPTKNKDAVLLLAPGGSLKEATVPGHRQFVQWLKSSYNIKKGYSGALGVDEPHVMLANSISGQNVLGAMYFYADDKLRQAFEGYYYAFMASFLGAETTDAEQPLLNLQLTPQDEKKGLSANSMPFYSGSTWMTKLMMSWSLYIKERFHNKGVEAPTEQNLNAEWGKFLKVYIVKTTRLISEIARIKGRSEDDVRKALLSWDSTDKKRDYFPYLLLQPVNEIAAKLFPDNAMSAPDAKAENKVPVRAVGQRVGVNTFDGKGIPSFGRIQEIRSLGHGLAYDIKLTEGPGAGRMVTKRASDVFDAAMKGKSEQVEGGIDLNTSAMTTTIRKEGGGVEMKVDAALLAQIRKDGVQSLTPFIYKVTPITSIWSVLGMQVPL